MATVDMKDDNGRCVLLTEGTNDCHVIAALCKFHDIQEGRFGFYECGNDKKVLKKANALLQGACPKDVIGIVLDADVNISGRWESIKSKLSRNDTYNFPDTPVKAGTILKSTGMPTLGIWIMPNNLDVGMLEDFCATLIDEDKLNTVKSIVDNIKGSDVATFKDVQLSKAEIHTYLAWQDEPGRPLGQSITANTLKPDTDTAKVFVEWLSRLFPLK